MSKNHKIVVAHPDDEIIFFNSILESAEATIICFGPCGSTTVTEGRQRVRDTFPLSSANFLWINEADVFDPVTFPGQVVVREGLTVSRNAERYKRNFHLLVSRLKSELNENDTVFTHNPWGEYGHEEHVQVFNAVLELQKELNLKIHVSSYVSDRSWELMKLRRGLLCKEVVPGNPSQTLGQEYMDLYLENDCWTWDDKYAWPPIELFFSVRPDAGQDMPWAGRSTAYLPVNVLSEIFMVRKPGKVRSILSRFSPKRLLK